MVVGTHLDELLLVEVDSENEDLGGLISWGTGAIAGVFCCSPYWAIGLFSCIQVVGISARGESWRRLQFVVAIAARR